MRENLDAGLRLIKRHEGGYVDHPNDPGGCTNMGITIATYRREIDPRGTCADLRDLSWDDAATIYESTYWGQVNGDGLPPGLDLVLLDFGVNAGPRRAVKTLQRLIGTAADGIAGPLTIAAAWDADIPALLDEYKTARMRFYRSLRIWPTFGRGWTRRTNETHEEALKAYREYKERQAEDEQEPATSDASAPADLSAKFSRQLVFSREGKELMRLPLPAGLAVHIEEAELD